MCACVLPYQCVPLLPFECVFLTGRVGGREGAGDLFFVPHCRISPSLTLLPSNWPFLAPFFNYRRYICLYWQKHPFPIPSSHIQGLITQSWWFFFQSAASQPTCFSWLLSWSLISALYLLLLFYVNKLYIKNSLEVLSMFQKLLTTLWQIPQRVLATFAITYIRQRVSNMEPLIISQRILITFWSSCDERVLDKL